MTREFPDELLSAFLDDELSPAERAQVEQHLAASPAHQQLLAELKSLRSEVAGLPQVAVDAGFADRVVEAALSQAKDHDPAQAAVSLPPPDSRRLSNRWWIGAALASAAALAACFLLVVQPWRQVRPPGNGTPIAIDPGKAPIQIATIPDQVLKLLGGTPPAEGEAVVLRLRVNKDAPLAAALDAALAKAGIAPLTSDFSTGAASLAPAYDKAWKAKHSSSETQDFVAAAQAVFVEAPLEQFGRVITELGTGLTQPLQLEPECKLAFAKPKPEERAEGEPNSAQQTVKSPPPGQAFAQQLAAEVFHLERKLAGAAAAAVNPSPASPVNPKQLVRVLILVETQ